MPVEITLLEVIVERGPWSASGTVTLAVARLSSLLRRPPQPAIVGADGELEGYEMVQTHHARFGFSSIILQSWVQLP